MKTYVKIDKYDADGESVGSTIEPFNIEYVKVALEEKLIEEGDLGESVLLTIVEMDEEEFKTYEKENGY